MITIKEGQIYRQKNSEIFVITNINGNIMCCLYNDGYVYTDDLYHHLVPSMFWELLAEYPTWQEAVNSKEFKE